MRNSWKQVTVVLLFFVPFVATGCAVSLTTYPPLVHPEDVDHGLAGEVAASGSYHDNPFHLFGYALYPAGAMLEYVMVRPAYFGASLALPVFGYTVEDDFIWDLDASRTFR